MELFVTASDPSEWRAVLQQYPVILKQIASKKTKAGAGDELLTLDNWFQDKLPKILSERKPMFMTSEELVQLMNWKLSRGKFRPRLIDFAASNSQEKVQSTTKKAFQSSVKGKLSSAIKTLSELKGIGPATASAILTAGCAQEVAFMADQSVWGILGKQSLKYDLNEYLCFMEEIIAIRNRLNEKDRISWSAHDVELCVWTFYQAESLGVDISSELNSADENKTPKRKSDAVNTHVKKKKK